MIQKYKQQYHDALFHDVLPFWEKHSIDKKRGGFYTCLLRNGQVYDTDKFIWLQARQVWTFAMLYDEFKKNQEWLDIATNGAQFLQKYGRDKEGNWYFSLDQVGAPLVHPYNIFSDCFAAMAFAKLYKVTGEEEYGAIAITTFKNILGRRHHPKGSYSKVITTSRAEINFALPMILANLTLEMGNLITGSQKEELINECINAVMKQFYDPSTKLLLEHVTPDGQLTDTFNGRLVNPGHAIEAYWFIMDIAEKTNDLQLISVCTERLLFMIEYGWDQEKGGIFYFLDRLNKPLQQLEWDQKLWWVHLETLTALSLSYALTKNIRVAKWFEKVHHYSWDRFPDPEYGEWYGYLNREGKPLFTSKGGKWKGCFHVPRSLWKTYLHLLKIT